MSSAEQLAAHVHVLRVLVHCGLGRLPSEPRLDRKRTLARHAHEDARSIDALLERIAELPDADGLPGGPSDALTDVLGGVAAAAPETYTQLAYGTIKPALADSLRAQADALDPLLEEPTLELLALVRSRQLRHLDELPPAAIAPVELDTAVVRHGTLELLPHATADAPARDAWVETGEQPAGTLHGALNDELTAAEILARLAHEQRDLPWPVQSLLARAVADRVRHAGVVDAAMGGHWGEEPVDTGAYAAALSSTPAERVAAAIALADRAAAVHPPLALDAPLLRRLAASL